MGILEHLEPQKVFYFFEEICQIPHGSGNVEAISDYLKHFAVERGLNVIQDELKNIIIVKEAQRAMKKNRQLFCRGIWIWWRLRHRIVLLIYRGKA